MLALYLILLVVPACAILLWERFVAKVAPHAWHLYAATGIVGSPVHELAHVVGCTLFRLPIRKIVLYKPDRSTGQMGYVLFAYCPDSWWHRVGMAVQGIAPLIVGSAVAVLGLGLSPYAPQPGSATAIGQWLWAAASTPFPALLALLQTGPQGVLVAVLVVCVSQHAIPSIADMKVGWQGAAALLLLFASLAGLSFWALGEDYGFAARLPVLRDIFSALEYWLWCLAFGVVGIMAITVSAAIFLLLLPSLVLRQLSRPYVVRD